MKIGIKEIETKVELIIFLPFALVSWQVSKI